MSGLLIQPREPIEIPHELMLFLKTFSEFAQTARMGLHCAICKQDIVGGSHFAGDVKLTMQCGCRKFVGIDQVALVQKRNAERQTEALKHGTADLSVQ